MESPLVIGDVAMDVAHVMTSQPVCVERSATIEEAARLMLDRGVSGLPVVDQKGELAGMVTEADLLRRPEIDTAAPRRHRWLELLLGKGPRDYVHRHGRRVEDVMTRGVISVRADMPLADAVETMESARVKRLPVVEDRRVVGIISRADILRSLAATLHRQSLSPTKDAAITRRITADLKRELWGQGVDIVIVRDGIVHVWGVVSEPAARDAIRALVERVPGVRALRDHLGAIGDDAARSAGERNRGQVRPGGRAGSSGTKARRYRSVAALVDAVESREIPENAVSPGLAAAMLGLRMMGIEERIRSGELFAWQAGKVTLIDRGSVEALRLARSP